VTPIVSAILNLIRNQPAKVTAAIQGVFGALLAVEAIHLTGVQIGAIIIGANGIFGLFNASQVTPNVRLPDSVVKAAAEGDPPIPEIQPQP
jgi:hypothetical protein